MFNLFKSRQVKVFETFLRLLIFILLKAFNFLSNCKMEGSFFEIENDHIILVTQLCFERKSKDPLMGRCFDAKLKI